MISPKSPDKIDFDAFLEFRQSKLAGQLFARTLQHPELGSLVAWAPTKWLATLANPEPLQDTTTSGADGKPDRRVDLPTLYAGMMRCGMRDPFVVGTGLNRKTRLEEGNQRIRCLEEHEIPFAPIVSYINDTAVTNPENGLHKGRLVPLIGDVALVTYYPGYTSPLEIFAAAVPITAEPVLAHV